jgi:membrane peptidoglycan carboxypeptidase
VVEWGNNVYGIGEASHYYFGKSPSELTLGEGIYLASILPHPKTGLYSFQPDGTLRPNLAGYYKLIGNMMAGHGWTEPDTTNDYGYFNVRLKESLRREVAPVPTSVADSLMKQNNDDDDDSLIIPEQTQPQPEKKPTFIQRLFGKKDTTKNDEFEVDTAGKTKKQIRQERRALKKLEKEREKELHDKGLK